MRRSLVILVAFLALSAWAGGQGPRPALSPADRVKLFKADQPLIDNLVDHGVKLADADDPLKRAEECRRTARSLANALERMAKDEQDADRVIELATLMGDVIRDGLTPNLDEAKRTFPAESRQGKRTLELGAEIATDLDNVAASIPADSKVASNPKVKDALAALTALKAGIGK